MKAQRNLKAQKIPQSDLMYDEFGILLIAVLCPTKTLLGKLSKNWTCIQNFYDPI
jgi:hypothetical protein